MADRNVDMARAVAERVAEVGGRTFFVGGFVRDRLLGRENKDVDIEVHGVDVTTLEGIMDSLGRRRLVGESFGILNLDGYDLDVSMPRSEVAVGRGHRDFEVSVDPFIGCERAARRRDLTINALMEDVLTGEVLDFFGGRDDLARGVIRHVDAGSFVEDPLRVFRSAQFAARFGFSVAGETSALARGMDVCALSRERVMGELSKAMSKSERPSTFFRELGSMGHLSEWFPEVEALRGVPQDVVGSSGGDVWEHTMLTCDAAAGLRSEAELPDGLMLSALFHDVGKAVTTRVGDDGRVHADGHDVEGVSIARRALSRLTGDRRLVGYVCDMTRMHMRPGALVRDGAGEMAFMRMFDDSRCPEDLLLLSEADSLGRVGGLGGFQLSRSSYQDAASTLRGHLDEYRRRMAAPHVDGYDLIDAGYGQGPLVGEGLSYARGLRLAGIGRDEQLRRTLDHLADVSGRELVQEKEPPSFVSRRQASSGVRDFGFDGLSS